MLVFILRLVCNFLIFQEKVIKTESVSVSSSLQGILKVTLVTSQSLASEISHPCHYFHKQQRERDRGRETETEISGHHSLIYKQMLASGQL